MRSMLLVSVMLAFFMSIDAFATSARRGNVTIVNIHPVAIARQSHGGVTRVYVNHEAWGGTDCRPTAGDIQREDTHLLSILLTAWALGKLIDMEVESSRKITDDVCQIVSLNVK